MRSKLIITALITLAGFQSMAQEREHRGRQHEGERMTPEERLEKNLERMDEELDLTDDQESKIRVILKDSHSEMKALRTEMQEGEKAEREEFKEKMKAIHSETHSEILQVLNDDQDAKFEEMARERHERMKNRMEKRRKRKEHKG